MIRSLGVAELIRQLLGPAVVAFAVVTQLGDLWLLFLVAAGVYWLGRWTPALGPGIDRRRGATLVALLLGAAAVTVASKAIFALPRPPGAGSPPRADLVPPALREVYAWLSTADGHGFPSGHAVGSTIVWGGLAWLADTGRRRTRLTVAAVLIGAVWLSRLALGVHYLVDVLAGGLVGLTYLAVVVREGRPSVAFALAFALSIVGILVAGPTRDATAVAGTTAAATATWWLIGDRVNEPADRPTAVVTATLGVGAAALAVLVVAIGGTDPLVVGPAAAAGMVGVLGLPLAVERAKNAIR